MNRAFIFSFSFFPLLLGVFTEEVVGVLIYICSWLCRKVQVEDRVEDLISQPVIWTRYMPELLTIFPLM